MEWKRSMLAAFCSSRRDLTAGSRHPSIERRDRYPEIMRHLTRWHASTKLDFIHLGYEALSINTLGSDPLPGFLNVG